MELIDKTKVLIAQITPLAITHSGNIFTTDGDSAGSSIIETRQKIEQCRFTRAGAANNRYSLTPMDIHIDTIEDHQLTATLTVTLHHIATR